MIRTALNLLLESRDLSADQAHAAMQEIVKGEASDTLVAAFITALRVKGETPAELAACAAALRSAAIPVRPKRTDLMDVCGTGGDSGGTFNISTTVSFVMAGMGVAVAKHGNRSVSSRCGSADVMEALGVKVELSPARIAACIDEAGIGFLYAPRLHAGMGHVATVRRELGIRTVFNMLGPLINPTGPRRQLLGAYSLEAAEKLAAALVLLGCDRAWVVHSHDGMDELSPCAPTTVFQVAGNEPVTKFEVNPRDVGIHLESTDCLAGGDAAQNALLIESVLANESCGALEVVVLNAGAGAVAAGLASDLTSGVQLARESLRSGRAMLALTRLRELSNAETADMLSEVTP